MEAIIKDQTEAAECCTTIEPQANKSIIGVQILRYYMAFMVVSTHVGGSLVLKGAGIFYIFQPFHVPVFMLLSFLLCGRCFLAPTKALITKRTLRIIIPFVFWGIASYLLCLILWPISFPTLLNQLITGYPLNNALWYLATMLWICILFWILRSFTSKRVFLIIISALSVACIISQYTGLNYSLFNNLPYNIKFTIGRTFEMIPYATIGILLSTIAPFLYRLNKKQHVIIFLSSGAFMAIIIAIRTLCVSYRPKGFDYAGAYLIIIAVLLVISAYTNPINFVQNRKFRNFVKWITSFTLGIFCMHIVIGRFIEWAFIALHLVTYNSLMAVTTYISCYIISFLIWLIPNKYTRQTIA